ncbi:MAG: ABC transporter substrate-binding protein [Alphaproteobacteria bacterium]|nr:ABC transporter substrate-binding protein [Alphaproteobacteria bacterium]
MQRRTLVALTAAISLFAGQALAQGAKDTLSVDLPGQPATLDPHIQWDTDSYHVYRNIFDNLVTRDAAGTIIGQVASAWTYRTPTEIEFTIRTDIKFHDGSPLTAEDVVYSVKRITDPAFKSPQLSQFDSIKEARVVAPDKVVLITEKPYPVLLAQLVKLSIVPKAHVEKVGPEKFNLEPMGSGPYKFASWQRGVRVSLEANDAYWRGKPAIRAVTFQNVSDEATRIANLKSGRADIIRAVSPDQAQALKSEARLKLLPAATERIGYLFINAQWGPTADVRVRRAIAHAIDRKTIVDALYAGFGTPVDVVLTPANFGYVTGIPSYPFDPAKARALIKEAGAEGAELPFTTSPAYDSRLVQALQQMLQDVGLKVTIQLTDHPTFLKRRQGNPGEAGSISTGLWSCGCQDADGVINPLFRTGSSWAKYSNPKFDAAIDAARATIDGAERLKHYTEALKILYEDVPGVGMFQYHAIYAARREIQWQPTAGESFAVFDMKWQP